MLDKLSDSFDALKWTQRSVQHATMMIDGGGDDDGDADGADVDGDGDGDGDGDSDDDDSYGDAGEDGIIVVGGDSDDNGVDDDDDDYDDDDDDDYNCQHTSNQHKPIPSIHSPPMERMYFVHHNFQLDHFG